MFLKTKHIELFVSGKFVMAIASAIVVLAKAIS